MKAATSIGIDRDWQAESDMRTLVEAQAIKNDPKRYAAAKKKAQEKAKEIEKVFDQPTKGK